MPLLLVPAIALIALPLVGSLSTWMTLTMAGLAMGMIFFIIASGLTLVFVNGRILSYYLVFFAALILFLLMLRAVNSPFGRVLQAIRENEFRAEALGYRTVVYRSIGDCLAAAAATSAGVLSEVWLRYTGPAVTLSFDIMLDILLMVVIGGMGTLYGAVIGATIFVLAESYLQSLMAAISHATEGVPVLPLLFHPDRWPLWLGVLFVVSVYFFPAGIVGRLGARR